MKTSQQSPKAQVPLLIAFMIAGFLTVAIPNLLEHFLDVKVSQQTPQTITKVAK